MHERTVCGIFQAFDQVWCHAELPDVLPLLAVLITGLMGASVQAARVLITVTFTSTSTCTPLVLSHRFAFQEMKLSLLMGFALRS